MIAALTSALPRRALAAAAASLIAAASMVCIRAAWAGTPTGTTVGNYLERLARAMGLQSREGPPMQVDRFAAVLVQQHVISDEDARGLSTNVPLTRDFAIQLSSHITNPPAPSFLSQKYVVTAWLGDHGTGLGLVRDDDETDKDLFEARAHEGEHHCPTPMQRGDGGGDDRSGWHSDGGDTLSGWRSNDDDDRCPREP